MSIYKNISDDWIDFRKDIKAPKILSAGMSSLISRIKEYAKTRSVDKANYEILDEHCIACVRKELAELEDTIKTVDPNSILLLNSIILKKQIEKYLPVSASEEDILDYMKQYDSGDTLTMKDMGKIIKSLEEKFGVALDKKIASQIVKGYING